VRFSEVVGAFDTVEACRTLATVRFVRAFAATAPVELTHHEVSRHKSHAELLMAVSFPTDGLDVSRWVPVRLPDVLTVHWRQLLAYDDGAGSPGVGSASGPLEIAVEGDLSAVASGHASLTTLDGGLAYEVEVTVSTSLNGLVGGVARSLLEERVIRTALTQQVLTLRQLLERRR
jgi:hypothetical protein